MGLFSKSEKPTGSISEDVMNAEKEGTEKPSGVIEPKDTTLDSVYDKKSYLKISSLKFKAGKRIDVMVPKAHHLLQGKGRINVIERQFADLQGVNSEDFDKKIRQLEKNIPWMKGNTKAQARIDLSVLKQLSGKAA